MTRVKVKVRFDATRRKMEKFGPNMYLLYLDFPRDDESTKLISEFLARYLGIPFENVNFSYVDSQNIWYFDLE